MKRSEIQVGEAYYYDRSTNWEAGSYGFGCKAVVVDAERYTIRRDTWGFRRGEERYSKDPKGTAVLVDLHRQAYDGTERTEREAVPVAHLRGPFEETKTAVEARRAEDRDSVIRAEAWRSQQRRLAEEACVAANGLGVNAARDYSDDGRVTVPVAQFAAMVDALAAAGWRYEQEAGS